MNQKDAFIDAVFGWYLKHKKEFSFPWRKTANPYHILVSEIMLQQTQISRVLPKYKEWLEEFPTIESLAEAPFSKVLRAWHGLGYNRRARYMKECARVILENHKGRIPKEPEALEKIPGIGHYTSRAVACFAYGRCEPFFDTNIRRVYMYFFFSNARAGGGSIDDKKLRMCIAKNTPNHATREWYYALMDYGREVLGKTRDNPNRKSKGYKKQSSFIGSQRQARAEVVSQLLLAREAIQTKDLARALKRSGISASYIFPRRLSSILVSLEKERLITRRGNMYVIAD